MGLRKAFEALNRLDDRVLGRPVRGKRYYLPRSAFMFSILLVIFGPALTLVVQSSPPNHESAFYGSIGGLLLGTGLANIFRFIRERIERLPQEQDGQAEDQRVRRT